jgi:hypothetical protein
MGTGANTPQRRDVRQAAGVSASQPNNKSGYAKYPDDRPGSDASSPRTAEAALGLESYDCLSAPLMDAISTYITASKAVH